jgi:hypothetical protein
MAWPLSQDYNEAIQNPTTCFLDPELKRGEAVVNALGLPQPCSGNFADVYAVQSSGRKWAVKCFTRQIPGLQERYLQISQYLQKANLPFMVEFSFLEKGIQVRGTWYPVLKMQWVEGFALNTFVRDNLEKPQVLQSLSQIWLRLAVRLREANLAHCDLQHGNVLLVPGSKAGSLGIKLVDYDGMCVPALELLKSIELGHANYQHPQRLKEGTYHLRIDRFPHLVIYTAIKALSIGGKALWDRFDNGDNLLFAQKDFAAPSRSPVIQELLKCSDTEVRKLAQTLARAAQKPIDQVPLLEELVETKAAAKLQTAVQPAAPSVEDVFAAATSTSDPDRRTTYARKKKSSAGMALAASSAAVLLIGGLVALATMREAPMSEADVVANVPVQPTSRPLRVEITPTPRRRTEFSGVEPKKAPEPKKEGEAPTDPAKPELKKEREAETDPVKPALKKPPVPDAAALAQAGKVIKETFKTDYANLKTAADRSALAAKLIQTADDTTGDAASRYALLREARELAAQAGELTAAFQAVDKLAESYDVDVLAMKSAVLTALSRTASSAMAGQILAETCLTLVEDAVSSERHEIASRLLALAEPAARKTKSSALLTRVQGLGREVREAQNEFEQATAAAETLKQTADDPAANLIVGRYLCRRKGNWAQGLPLLVRGADPVLCELAKRDLMAPEDAGAQTVVGDAWWDLAAKEPELARAQLLHRAVFWYRLAVPELSGLAKNRLEKRIADANAHLPASVSKTPSEGVLPVGADGKPLNLDFETGTLKDWTAEGDAFTGQPVKGDLVAMRIPGVKSQHQGQYWIGGFEVQADRPQGTLTSVAFKVTHPWASFLVGGGAHETTCVELVSKDTGAVFHRSSGLNRESMRRVVVDLKPVRNKAIFIRLVDRNSGEWGHINFDDFRFHSENPNTAAASDPQANPKVVDLLKLIDVTKDARTGKWQFSNGTLISPHDLGVNALQIPYSPPSEYHISLTVERKGGDDDLDIGILRGGRQALVVIDGWGWARMGNRTGLDRIATRRANENDTTHKGRLLELDKTTKITCTVRKHEITLVVGERKIFTYTGDSDKLSLNADWEAPLKNKALLSLGALNGSRFHITRLELTPISGQGKLVER